jgi:hypothetical protein
MRFEDALPLIRAGRLVRRSIWESGVCIGATPYHLQDGSATNFLQFSRYDNDSSNRSWYSLHASSDVLAEDWEVVPKPPKYAENRADLNDAVSSVILELTNREIPTYPESYLEGNLNEAVQGSIRAYKSQDEECLRTALAFGLAALIQIRAKKPS